MNSKPLLCIGCKHCKKWFSRANGWAYYCDSKECNYNRKDDEIDRDINSACINFGSLALHPVGFTEDI